MRLEPGAGSTGVKTAAPAKVTVERGKIGEVTLTNSDGEEGSGRLAADGESWSTTEELGYGETYSF